MPPVFTYYLGNLRVRHYPPRGSYQRILPYHRWSGGRRIVFYVRVGDHSPGTERLCRDSASRRSFRGLRRASTTRKQERFW